jgi:hypothetical protein
MVRVGETISREVESVNTHCAASNLNPVEYSRAINDFESCPPLLCSLYEFNLSSVAPCMSGKRGLNSQS